MSYKSNITKFYFFRILSALEFTIAIYVLFMLSNHLSMFQVMLLETICMITVLFLEVPSGIFADFYGRKTAISISILAACIGFIIFGLGSTFWVFLIAQLLFSIGWAFESGADMAFIYDSLKEDNKQKDFDKVYGKINFFSLATWSIVSIISGILATILNYRTLFFFTATVFFIAFILSLTFKEPPIHKKNTDKKYFKHLKEASKFAYNHKIVKNLIIYYALFAALTHLMWYVIQPYFATISEFMIGIGSFFYFSFAGIGSLIANKVISRFKDKQIVVGTLILVAISFILLFFTNKWIALIVIAFMSLFSGIRDIFVSKGIHDHTDSKHRATVGSIQSFSKSILYAIFAPLLGYFMDIFTANAAFLLMGISLGIFGIYNWIFFKNT
jgi:MFS family permease